MNNTHLFTKRYLVLNEVLNAVTHGIGVILSIIALVLLVRKGINHQSAVEITAYSIYGASMILLYLCSTLYHSFSFTHVKRILKILDHSSIYLLIAGTYTPYCLITIGGKFGTAMLIAIWTIAFAGILFKTFFIGSIPNISTLIYIGMGLSCLIGVKPLYQGLGTTGLTLLCAGGATYIIGTIFYSLRKIKFMHVIWHLFVMGGSILMFFSIYFYV